MSMRGRRLIVAAGVAGAVLGLAVPAVAQHGGGHGGGGHVSSGGGGGHLSGGGGHFSGGGGHAPGGAAHYSGPSHVGASAGHYAGGAAHGYYGGGYRGGVAYGGHPGYGYPGHGYGHGYSTGAYWGGGYWRGGYWPRAYYGYGYSWFLPVLPLAYATYWYGGIPYYYANDVYYTWNPDYSGYTATDPPPASGPAASDGSAALPPTDLGAGGPAGAPDPGAAGQIYMYPKNGQSEAQQSTDRRECQQWATAQAGGGAANGNDYRRAMMACIEGRGYSAN